MRSVALGLIASLVAARSARAQSLLDVRAVRRDTIKATVGFEQLAKATGAPAKSLIRMFGPRGNPQAKNLFAVIGYLQKKAGLHLRVAA